MLLITMKYKFQAHSGYNYPEHNAHRRAEELLHSLNIRGLLCILPNTVIRYILIIVRNRER